MYPHTVPEGSGKGTLAAVNGLKATEYLRRAERLTPHSQPFSWVLFRPPWAPNHLCYKACVCNQMKQVCNDASTKVPVYFQVQCSSQKPFTEWGKSLACSHACSETTALGANHVALGIAFLCVHRNVPRKGSSPIRVVSYPVLAFGWRGVLLRRCSPGEFRSLVHDQ